MRMVLRFVQSQRRSDVARQMRAEFERSSNTLLPHYRPGRFLMRQMSQTAACNAIHTVRRAPRSVVSDVSGSSQLRGPEPTDSRRRYHFVSCLLEDKGDQLARVFVVFDKEDSRFSRLHSRKPPATGGFDLSCAAI